MSKQNEQLLKRIFFIILFIGSFSYVHAGFFNWMKNYVSEAITELAQVAPQSTENAFTASSAVHSGAVSNATSKIKKEVNAPFNTSGSVGNISCSASALEITGTVFEDFDYDGLYDTAENLGMEGITVTATDSLDNSFTATSASDGTYAISGLTADRTYRVDFTDIPSWASFTFYGGDNGTMVQFIQPGNCANLGLSTAANYCQSDPEVATTCYENGDGSNNNNQATISWTYSDSDLPVKFGGSSPNPTALTTIAQVGTVWGMDYDREADQIYMSAFTRRHISLGPLGTGGIYIANSSGYVGSFDLQGLTPANGGAALDFGTVIRSTVTGSITNGAGGNNQLSQNSSIATVDLDAFDKVGKTAMGDLDISEDGNFLWTVNLNDGEAALIRINLRDGNNPIPTNGSNPAGAIVNRYFLSSMTPPSCSNGVFRPWGLAFHRGLGYLGGICSAENNGSTANLKASVLSFDPENPTSLTEVLSFDLDFNREPKSRFSFSGGHTEDADWRPWADQWSDLTFNNNRYVNYTSPILSDIEFADNGDMVLGFADRYSFQLGYQQYAAISGASSGNSLYDAELGGDLYHVCFDGTNWILEGNTSCPDNDQDIPTFQGDITNDGPNGTGEYYWADYFAPSANGHAEITNGALEILKGKGEVVSNAFDPLSNFQSNTYANTHGIVKMSTSDGSRTSDYLVIDNNGTELGKSGGLSELVLLCDPAPIEIGNYVWLDADSDGVQDAGESPIEGIRMELYDASGILLAFDSTNNLGHYFFSGNGIDDAEWQTADELTANTSYYIVAGGNGQYSGGLTVNSITYQLTSDSLGSSSNRYEVDSDGTIAVGIDSDFDGEPYVQITTGNIGEVDHSFDFGFSVPCAINAVATAQNCTGTTSFTADWQVIITYSGEPTGNISFQRNSDVVGNFTPNMSPDTITISGIPADGGAYDTLNVWFTNDISCGDTIIKKRPSPCPATIAGSNPGEICDNDGANDISGSVWEDWNYNGVADENTIIGVQGIEVNIYDCDGNIVGTTYTDGNGNYTFNNTNTIVSGGLGGGALAGQPLEEYRVEFVLPESVSCIYQPTQAGANNGTTVQFVQPGDCASLGVASPDDYCQANPFLMLPCYVKGDNTGTDDVVVRWSSNNSGLGPDDKTKISNASDVGALWGMAYSRKEKLAYGSAVLKSHTGLHEGAGGGGLDAIFTIDPFIVTNGTLWLELQDDLGIDVGQNLVLSNAARGLATSPQHDESVYSLIGTVGIGDIAISTDNKTLFVMNLYDKKLYEIDIASKTTTSSFAVPDPGCTGGTYRPWAVEFYKGSVYVGSICDGSSSGKDATASDALTNTTGRNNLEAFVYRLDGTTFSEVLNFDLDYKKQPSHGTWGNHVLVDGWFPWTNDLPIAATGFASGSSFQEYHSYPTPVLSNIVFDTDGSMILGFLDRTAMQIGDLNYGPEVGNENLMSVFAGGDILRACKNGDTWLIEGSANSCTNAGGHALGTNTGYHVGAVGEYYGGEFFDADAPASNPTPPFGHPETAIGSLVLLPGSGQVISTAFDPNSGDVYFKRGGIIKMDNSTGQYISGFEVYGDNSNTFGKGIGLGELIVICNPAPIEIGNFVWEDTDKDGIQGACEKGIADVTIELLKDGNVIATTKTDINGQYYFSDKDAADAELNWTGINADTTLLENTSYTLRISNAIGGSQQTPLNTFALTTNDANSNGSDLIDSDASLNGNNAEITVTTGDAGTVNHSLDFGFSSTCATIENPISARTICSGDLVDTLSVTTTFSNPDSIAFVYFSTAQTDSIAIYNNGTSLAQIQITATSDTVRLLNATFANNNTTVPQVYFVYAIASPISSDVTCRPYQEIQVTVNPLPVADAGTDVSICLGNSTTLSASGGTTYAWSPATGLSASNISNPVANPTVTTTYTVTVTDVNGCESTDDIIITVNPLPTANAGADVSYCIGNSANLNASGGTSYAWSPTTGLSVSNIANPTANPIATTIYTVTVTEANGCESTDDVIVTVNPLPTANAGTDVAICTGSSTTLSASGGMTYAWSPTTGLSASNISNPVANPTSATTYTVTVTDANACVATDDVMITMNALPTVTATATDPTCAGPTANNDGSITLSGFTTEAYDFTIDSTYTGTANYATATSIPVDGIIVNNLPNPTTAQDYTVRIFTPDDCIVDRTITIMPVTCTIYDWGDLPDNSAATGIGDYTTLSANGGPVHTIIPGLHLGNVVDYEADGQPESLANGDNNIDSNDEDGITFLPTMQVAPGGNLNIPLSVTNTTGTTAHIEMWIDWNGDGDFDDANEMVADLNDGNGATPFADYLPVSIPVDVVLSQNIGVRIRLSNEDNMTPYGAVASGEVEDYMIQITCGDDSCISISASTNP